MKKGYYYCTNDLIFKKKKTSFITHLKQFLYFIIIALIAGNVTYFVLSVFNSTPDKFILSKEKEELINKNLELKKRILKVYSKLNTIQSKDDSLYRPILGLQPLSSNIRNAGYGGSQDIQFDNEILKATSKELIVIEKRINIQLSSLNRMENLANKKEIMLEHFPAIQPVSNRDINHIGSGYGNRMHPILGFVRPHYGIDFVAPRGVKIYATADGVVKDTRYSISFGNCIVINHGYGLESLYAHLSKISVTPGQKIKRGDVIGFVGSTGLSKGNHLHYEVHLDEVPVNPANYFWDDLSIKEYQQIVKK